MPFVGNVTSSQTQSFSVLMTGFFIRAGRRTVSPCASRIGSFTPRRAPRFALEHHPDDRLVVRDRLLDAFGEADFFDLEKVASCTRRVTVVK